MKTLFLWMFFLLGADAKPDVHLLSVQVQQPNTSELQIRVETSGDVLGYATQEIANPPRFILDLVGVKANQQQHKTIQSSPIGSIRIGIHPEKTRLVIDLTKELSAKPTVRQTKNGLLVVFPKIQQPTTATPPSSSPRNESRVTIDLQQANIHSVFKLIGQAGHVNLVASDKIEAKITVQLKEVTWMEALQAITDVASCRLVKKGT